MDIEHIRKFENTTKFSSAVFNNGIEKLKRLHATHGNFKLHKDHEDSLRYCVADMRNALAKIELEIDELTSPTAPELPLSKRFRY
tara:strand:- start:92 stop:346 length:255 start_codon:yes stop_codon:yes gene_type:complete